MPPIEMTSKEKEVVTAVVAWMRSGPTHSAVHLHKGQNAESVKAKLEVTGGIEILRLTYLHE